MIMSEGPIRFDSDELGCPHCKSPLSEGKPPFYYREVLAGSFDSLRCDFCGCFVLTESGFMESTKAITQQGLTGPVGDSTAIVGNDIKLSYPKASEIMSDHTSVKECKSETLAYNSIVTEDKATITPLASEYQFRKKRAWHSY